MLYGERRRRGQCVVRSESSIIQRSSGDGNAHFASKAEVASCEKAGQKWLLPVLDSEWSAEDSVSVFSTSLQQYMEMLAKERRQAATGVPVVEGVSVG